jgi:signal transduction histidine kinase
VLVPVARGSRLLGVLRVRLTGRVLEPADEDLLLAIGSACAEVIHKAGLRRELAESEHRLAIADERERVARDLHDSVGQLITGLGMQLTRYAAQTPDAQWRERLEELVELTVQGSRQIGEAVHSLLFFQVRRRGLVRSLRELAQTFQATSGITTSFHVKGRAFTLAPAKDDALFRVAHEALTNVHRHSGAPSVSIVLSYDGDEVCLTVRDQGAGLGKRDPFKQQHGHFGLLGIQQRIEDTGGELLVANAYPRGVLVEARVRLRRKKGSHAPDPRRRD